MPECPEDEDDGASTGGAGGGAGAAAWEVEPVVLPSACPSAPRALVWPSETPVWLGVAAAGLEDAE